MRAVPRIQPGSLSGIMLASALILTLFTPVFISPVMADGYARPGQPAEAEADGEKSKTVVKGPMPGRSDSTLDYAADLLSRKKYAQAISVLEDVLKRNPANADAYAYLGFANLQLGDLDAAESKLRLALKIDSRHLGANQHLGEVFAKRGKTARALDQLTVLKMLCRTSCPEKEALEAAINAAGKG